MPLNLSFTHIAVVGIVALVVLGPERLPGVARTAGNLWREWQRIRGGLEGEVREVLNEFKQPFEEHFGEINNTVKGVVDDVRGAVPPTAASAPPLTELPPLPGAPLTGVALATGLPSLGAATGLVSPGPDLSVTVPELGSPADPDTFVPFTPAVINQLD